MARIQVLPLPAQKVGQAEHTSFILILDQCDRTGEDWPADMLFALEEATGAAYVLAHETTVDAPRALTLTDEERDQLREYLLTPRRATLSPGQEPDTLHLTPVPRPLHATP